MKVWKKISSFLLAGALVFTGVDTSAFAVETTKQHEEKSATIELVEGELTRISDFGELSSTQLEWQSGDESIVEVDSENGIVTAMSSGVTEISTNSNGETITYKITVKKCEDNEVLTIIDDWNVTKSDSKVTLVKYAGTETAIIIPAVMSDGTNYYDVTLQGTTSNGESCFPVNMKSIKIHQGVKSAQNISWLFYRCSNLTTLDLSGLDTSETTWMRYMFAYCNNLTTLDVSGFDTSNVEQMGGLFYYCKKLESLNVSTFNTSKVTNMSKMFEGCEGLQELDLSTFDTSRVTDLSGMFRSCEKLKNIDLSSFNTSSVTSMGSMFYGFGDMETLDLTNFDTSKVTNMANMFWSVGVQCLDLSSFDTSNVKDMSHMFYNTKKLQTIYATNSFVTEQVTSDEGMFQICTNIAGGAGTAYTIAHIDHEYARIDHPENNLPGYFTIDNSYNDISMPTVNERPLLGVSLVEERPENDSAWDGYQIVVFTSEVSPTYQWYCDGVELPEAKSSSYIVTEQDIGHEFSVSVGGNNSGEENISDTFLAERYVAIVGTNGYLTVQDALSASTSRTIRKATMIADVSETVRVYSASNISLDLNGHIFQSASESNRVIDVAKGTFNLYDSGTNIERCYKVVGNRVVFVDKEEYERLGDKIEKGILTGGAITGGKVVDSSGGGISVSGTAFNMYGGMIKRKTEGDAIALVADVHYKYIGKTE